MSHLADSPVFAAPVGDDLVLFEAATDTYLCVRGPLSEADLRDVAGAACCGPSAGLGAPVPAIGAVRSEIAVTPDPGAGLTLGERLQLALAVADLLVAYPRRSLWQLMRFAADRRQAAAPDPAEVQRLAVGFEREVLWLPVSRKCVVRSFLLARLLQRCGQGGVWVVGVRTWPFAAHCWLQLEHTALDDAPERLRAYRALFSVNV